MKSKLDKEMEDLFKEPKRDIAKELKTAETRLSLDSEKTWRLVCEVYSRLDVWIWAVIAIGEFAFIIWRRV